MHRVFISVGPKATLLPLVLFCKIVSSLGNEIAVENAFNRESHIVNAVIL